MEEVVQTLPRGLLTRRTRRYGGEIALQNPYLPHRARRLAARIDRLPAEEKDLFQHLAVIGGNFP